MNYYKNGILIQQINEKNIFLKKYADSFIYNGVHALNTAPLVWFKKDKDAYIFSDTPLSDIKKDREAEELFEKQISKKIGENAYKFLEFFTDKELLKAYIAKCDSLEIPIRFLFVESSRYAEEIWPYEIPERTFLGYEVAEIPLDPWTLLDLTRREQYECYRKALNENGLFKTEEEALDFLNVYQKELDAGLVGDGPVDLNVCKVYEVALADLNDIIQK